MKYTYIVIVSVFLLGCVGLGFFFKKITTPSIPVVVVSDIPKIFPVRLITPPDFRPKIGNPEDRMGEPVLPENPSQADLGTYEFWLRCMVCHGDIGQGLTDEWREAWGPEHMNCWESKCHGNAYPPDGFKLMESAPSIIRPFALARFNTAEDYFNFIANEMPWWNRGSLETEVSWQLTAYLLRENGIAIEGDINEGNASRILLNP